MPSGKVASGAAARYWIAKRVPSGLVDRTVRADAFATFAAGSSLIADGARNGHCFTRTCGSYRLRECSMSLDALFLIVLIVILRRVIPGVAARLGLGLQAIPRRPFDHRRHSLMPRGYL
jgi:hypothetical protein